MSEARRGRPRLQIDIEQLRQMQARGLSLRRIAQEVGVSKDTVRDALCNPVGKMSDKSCNGKTPLAGTLDRGAREIVDPEANQGVKTIMKQEGGRGSIIPVEAHKKDVAHRPKYSEMEKSRLKEMIVEALVTVLTIGVAAREVGLARSTVVAWQDQDEDFRARCEDAIETRLDRLEYTMAASAENFNQPHKATMGMFILNGYRRERFMPMTRHEHVGAGGGPVLIAVAAKIKLMDTDTLRFELGKLLGSALVEGPKPEQEEQR